MLIYVVGAKNRKTPWLNSTFLEFNFGYGYQSPRVLSNKLNFKSTIEI